MRRVLVAALVFSGWAAASASAQDSASARVAAAHSRIDWSGLYVGASPAYLGAGGSGNVAGSLFTGYNFEAGRTVAGIETGVTLTDVTPAPGQRLNSLVDLRGRLGVTFDRVHLYGTAGAAWAPDSNSWDSGFAAGAGVEGAFTQKTFWGLQYVRYTFRNFRNTGNTLEVDLVSGRVSYKF